MSQIGLTVTTFPTQFFTLKSQIFIDLSKDELNKILESISELQTLETACL
jgi:hypothetical protein